MIYALLYICQGGEYGAEHILQLLCKLLKQVKRTVFICLVCPYVFLFMHHSPSFRRSVPGRPSTTRFSFSDSSTGAPVDRSSALFWSLCLLDAREILPWEGRLRAVAGASYPPVSLGLAQEAAQPEVLTRCFMAVGCNTPSRTSSAPWTSSIGTKSF